MGIDGIGNRGGAGGIGGPGGPGAAGGPGAPTGATGPKETSFDAHLDPQAGTQHASAVGNVANIEGAPLQQLRSGHITLNQYLDQKVDQATSHLGALPAHQRSAIREALRAQMSSDPALTDLVQKATGQLPEPTDA
jgi:hypothetical protein